MSNSKAQELLGVTEDQMIGKTAFDPVWKFLRPDKKEMPVDEYPVNQVFITQKPLRSFACGLGRPSKANLLWVLVSADPVFDNKGKIQQVIVTFVDVSEREQAQNIIKEQAATLNNILEKAADGICVCHNIPEKPYVRFTHWNPRMTDITGYTINEINKLGWYQTVYPDPEIRQQAIEKMARMREDEDLHSEEWVVTTKSGKEKHLSISTSVVKKANGEVHVLAIMQDVSVRRKAEEALRESQREYQNIIEKSDDIIWTADLDIRTTYVSPSIEKKLGFTQEERMAQNLEMQIPPSSYTAIMECLAQELERENDETVDPDRIIRMEVEYYHKNGSTLWFENIASGLRDENGALIGIQGISRDITDKKIAEKALRESEEKYKLLAEHSADVIYKLHIKAEQCTYASPAIERLLGYTVKESCSLKAQELLTAESYAKQREILLKSIESGYRKPVTLELEAIHKDGHTLPVEISDSFLFDERGNPVEILGVARDITERKQAQTEKARLDAQTQQLQKAKSLECMAGSIAHHFNNLLTVVIGNLELGMDDQSKGESLIENLSEAMEAAHKAADLSTMMLTYLGVTPGEFERIDISEACRSHLPLLQTTMPEGVILESDFPSPSPVVRANATQIKQILTQLISNAQEAVGKERGFIQLGVKALSAADIPASNRFPVDWQPQDKNYICLTVSDTGCGIAQKDIEKLFDPFFSSKFTGRGLGLSVLLGIVRMHQGAVAVKSDLGRGSVFQVFLPVGSEI